MKIKAFITSLLLMCSVPLFAQAPQWGFYVGADVTGSAWDIDMKNTQTLVFMDAMPTMTNQFNYSETPFKFAGQVRAGLFFDGFLHEQFYTAVEIFVGAHDVELDRFTQVFVGTEIDDEFSQCTKIDFSYGVDLKPGFFIRESWLLFVKIGASKTHYSIVTQIGDFIDEPTGFVLSHKTEPDLWGFRFGVGVEKFIKENFSISLQTLYITHEDFSRTVAMVEGPTTPYDDLDYTNKLKVDTSVWETALGINLYFY